MVKEYRGRWIHHFCVSQFIWIHKLSMMTQFNSIHLFLDVQKRLDSQFSIILALSQNTANTSPLHICLISSQPTRLIKADCHLMLLEFQTVALIFNEIDKNLNFICVIVFPLSLRRQLISLLYQLSMLFF